MKQLLGWLGVDTSASTLRTLMTLSRERFSELGVVDSPQSSFRDTTRHRLNPRPLLRRVAGRVASPDEQTVTDAPDSRTASEIVFLAMRALHSRDSETLDRLASSDFELIYRDSAGDLVARGDEARSGLQRIAHELFGRRYTVESWTSGEGGPGEWWTQTPGKPISTVFFSGIGGDATRVDVSFGLNVEFGQIQRLLIISAGPLSGRPVESAYDEEPSSKGQP